VQSKLLSYAVRPNNSATNVACAIESFFVTHLTLPLRIASVIIKGRGTFCYSLVLRRYRGGRRSSTECRERLGGLLKYYHRRAG
jgi:hypothetical protein